MADEALDLEHRPRRRWPAAVGWPLVVLLGWVLFELTAQPALVVIALCLKFGWNDLRTAWWLRRRDPRRGRGWACFFLYLARGLWKVTLSGVLLLIALFAVAAVALELGARKGQAGGWVAEQFMAALVTGLLGAVLAMPLTWAAVVLALRTRSKLWLDGAVHSARREDCWPPPDVPYGRANHAAQMTLGALILAWFATLTGGVVVMALQPAGKANPTPVLAGYFLAAVVLGVYAVYWLQNTFERTIIARSPSDCWGRRPCPEDEPDDRVPC